MAVDARPTILVIDDDAGIAAAIKEVLLVNGIRCILATSCQDATELMGDAQFLRLPVHGVLTDVRLPDGLGYTLIDACRQHFPDVPVAVMTAYADEHVLNWLQTRGVPFLQKPFRIKQLLEWLHVAKAYAERHPFSAAEEADSWRLKLA